MGSPEHIDTILNWTEQQQINKITATQGRKHAMHLHPPCHTCTQAVASQEWTLQRSQGRCHIFAGGRQTCKSTLQAWVNPKSPNCEICMTPNPQKVKWSPCNSNMAKTITVYSLTNLLHSFTRRSGRKKEEKTPHHQVISVWLSYTVFCLSCEKHRSLKNYVQLWTLSAPAILECSSSWRQPFFWLWHQTYGHYL